MPGKEPFMPKIWWPKEVPILTSKDICRGKMSDNKGRHCLFGWRDATFRGVQSGDMADNAIKQAIHEARTVFTKIHAGYICWNDDSRNSLGKIAKVWNRAMAILGYTVGNPENKPLSDGRH